MNVREQVIKELEEIQKENEAKRHEYFKNAAKDIIKYYLENKQNFDKPNRNDLIEFARPFFPPIPFQKLINEGVFDE